MKDGEIESFQRDDGMWQNRVVGGKELEGHYWNRGQVIVRGRVEASRRGVGHVVRDYDGSTDARESRPSSG